MKKGNTNLGEATLKCWNYKLVQNLTETTLSVLCHILPGDLSAKVSLEKALDATVTSND